MRVATTTVFGVATSAWLPLDQYADGFGDGLFFDPGAGATASLEVTADDVFNPAVLPRPFALAAPFAGMVARTSGVLPYAAKAIRINQTVGATFSSLSVVVRGI